MAANTSPESIARSIHDEELDAFRARYEAELALRDEPELADDNRICAIAFVYRDCPFGHRWTLDGIPYKTPYHR